MRLNMLPLFLILSLFAVGIFGFLGFGSMDHRGQHSCPISLLSGGDCPSADSGAAFAFHHVLGVQYLSQFVINLEAFLLVFFVFSVFALLIFSKLLWNAELAPLALSEQQYYNATNFCGTHKKRLLRWLALRYKRDPRALSMGA